MKPISDRRRALRRWRNMIDRCTNPRNKDWGRYGGRGISVAREWFDFDTYYRTVGDPPGPGYSLDRINNDGSYAPGNVRWATAATQRANTSHDHNLSKKACPAGHAYDNENTYVYVDRRGWRRRMCRACNRAAAARVKARRRAALATDTTKEQS